MSLSRGAQSKNTLAQIKKRAFKLVNEGKLHEAIDSMVSDMNDLSVLAQAPLSFDMIFALEKKTLDWAKKRALKSANDRKLSQAALDSLILDLFDHFRLVPKMSFICGMATALKEDPHLSKERVVEWVERFGE
jgi:hypothetical protein